MNLSHVSKAIAGAGAAVAVGNGTLISMIPQGVEAPWWGYLIASAVSALIGFGTVYFAPKNKEG